VGVKYLITDAIAIRAALGLANVAASGGSATYYDLGAGFEYHFGGKGGVSPYAGAEVSYSGESISTGGTTPSEFGLAGVVGGEYFFSNNFSWAGEARLGFDSATSAGGVTTTSIGTIFGFSTFLTWYLN
ncbi:MAG TPA: outer membrane beta-barrel protein, partial [Spirochaetia bacterium]|nr:outer membrane beta-barrel protein [Spirochaetia bacterium]